MSPNLVAPPNSETEVNPPVLNDTNETVDEDWLPPAPPTDLIFDDGIPLESNRHRIAMNLLIRSYKHLRSDRRDFFTGGNMFIYYSSEQVRNRSFRGPDFFVVLDVDGHADRQGWVVWEEGGRYPDLIVELLSASTAKTDKGSKKHLYEKTFRTRDYFVYDPFDPSAFQGWYLNHHLVYEPLEPNDRGWLWSDALGLWLGSWEGEIEDDRATWLRFYTPEGQVVPLPEEEAQYQVEQERQRAEQERQRAEQERQRAEQECQRAEQERQRAERLAAQLRAMGVDPD